MSQAMHNIWSVFKQSESLVIRILIMLSSDLGLLMFKMKYTI